MFDFTDEHKMVRQMVRKWCDERLGPAVDDLEAERVLPYDLMRDFIRTFGIDEMARARRGFVWRQAHRWASTAAR